MKVIKFIIVVAVIICISLVLPCFMLNNINASDYYSQGENAFTKGPSGYYGLIIRNKNADEEILNNSTNIMKDYGNALVGQYKDMCKILFIVELLLGICIITIGILLLKLTSKKVISYSFIVSGILSIIAYIIIYVGINSSYIITTVS